MKAINIKLATFSFAAMLLASCSDSGLDTPVTPTSPAKNPKIEGSAVTQSTDAQELASRVYNYRGKNSGTRAFDSSAISDILSMPAEPTKAEAETNAIDITTITQNGDMSNGSFYVPENTKFEVPYCTTGNTTIYVEKGANLIWDIWGQKVKIVVLSGGTLTTKLGNMSQFAEIHCYGNFNFTGNDFIVNQPFYMNGDLDMTGKTFNVQGKCYIGGNLTIGTFAHNNGYLNVKGNMSVASGEYLSINGGVINVDKNLTFNNSSVNINNNAQIHSGCGIIVNNELNINSGTTIYVKYLKANKIIDSSGANIVLSDQSFIECNEFQDNNADNADWKATQGGSGSVIEGTNAVAVIKANKFSFNVGAPIQNDKYETIGYNCFMFRTPDEGSKIVVDGKAYDQNGNKIDVFFPGARIYWADDYDNVQDVIIRATECNNSTQGGAKWEPKPDPDQPTPNPTPDPTPKPGLVPISTIESDHTHDISATCLQPYGGKMYMSYHTRGAGHGSCVEVFDPVNANEEVTLLQYVYDQNGYVDWNHLMTHDNQVYVVGNHYKKAGVMGYIDIKQDGLLNTEPQTIVTENEEEKTIQPLNILALDGNTKGTDENCIAYENTKNRFVVMTTQGYVTYDANTLNEIEKVNKPGKAKHVAIGNGKLVTLVFNNQATKKDDPTEAIEAQLEVYNQGDDLETATPMTISTPAVMPHFGKNSVIVKNGKIYACLGAAGLYCYDLYSGAEIGHYQMPHPIIEKEDSPKKGQYKAYANGCFVGDDGKVYIAYGSYGIVVLKPGTLETGAPEKLAHLSVGMSANYITVYNGYIYVAYGQNRMQVFKLVNAD